MVELGEAERRLAQLAVLLLGVGQPLHQAVLMDELDAAAAFAGIEEWFVFGSLRATYSTSVGFIHAFLPLTIPGGIERRVVHDVGSILCRLGAVRSRHDWELVFHARDPKRG